jgi:hypothetical protein
MYKSRDSSFCIATGWTGSIPRRGKNFFFSTASRPALRPTQPPIQWVPGAVSLGGEGGHSPPCSAEVKNGGAVPSFSRTSSWRDA